MMPRKLSSIIFVPIFKDVKAKILYLFYREFQ